MMRLIVNADDFGMADAVDDGVIRGHRDGIITSTTLLAAGESPVRAAELARANPGLGVGVHLCLTRLKPVLSPDRVKSITSGGRLLSGPLPFMARLTFGIADRREMRSELAAQVARVISLGIKPTHIDGHQHLHVMPGVLPVVLDVAREYGIRKIRYPVGPATGSMPVTSRLEKFFLERLAANQNGRIDAAGMKRPDNFFGLAETGRLTASNILDIIKLLPDGTSELMCHPGVRDDATAAKLSWGSGWAGELAAVTDGSVIAALEDRGVVMVSYNGL